VICIKLFVSRTAIRPLSETEKKAGYLRVHRNPFHNPRRLPDATTTTHTIDIDNVNETGNR
jgi:hypothetical protein